MPIKVYLSSAKRPLDPDQAMISVFDRGFLFGDSVYETLRTAGGHAVEMALHLQRLRKSGEGIGLEIPFSNEDLQTAVYATLRASGNLDSAIRIIVTRGTSPLMLDPRQAQSPLLVIIVQELHVPSPEKYQQGLHVVIVDIQKTSKRSLDPRLKTGNYLANIQAVRQALDRQAEDAIMCNSSGAIAEGATSNVFMVSQGSLKTPSLETGLLQGITRTVVARLARELGMEIVETTIMPDELRKADEVFLTSSVRGIMPVTQLDGQPVSNGKVGPLTQQLMARYQHYLAEIASGED